MNKYVMYENTKQEAQESHYVHPAFKNVVNEFFDISDTNTRKILLNINEADQTQVLMNLTSKLYDNISERVDDIDYGDIPATKGDITKLPNYQKLTECIDIMHDLVVEYKQDTKPIDTVRNALDNIRTRKDMFYRAYQLRVELPMIMYSTMTLSVISSISFMIATCIEFVKTPTQENFNIVLDKVALSKTKQNLLFTDLDKFNTMCANGDFDKAMDFAMTSKVKGVREASFDFDAVSSGLGNILDMVKKVFDSTPGKFVIIIGAVIGVILLAKELIYFFYYSRSRLSDFFDAQADLLQMNAYNMENNETKDPEERKKIANKQSKIADFFRKIANKIAVDNKQSEVKATKEIASSNKKLTVDDVMDSAPDSAASVLF